MSFWSINNTKFGISFFATLSVVSMPIIDYPDDVEVIKKTALTAENAN